MKLALLNDFREYAGAEHFAWEIIKYSPKSVGVDFIIPSDTIDFDKYDGFILNNVVMFPVESLIPIVEKKTYIKVEHDFGYCRMRNMINCKNCDMVCPAQTMPFMKQLYENAKTIYAISPAHMRFQMQQLAGWKVKYDCIIPRIYKNIKLPDVERKPKSVAYLGTLRAYKGVYDIIKLAQTRPTYTFDLAGGQGFVKGQLPENVHTLGKIEDIWKYLCEHEYFIHVPRQIEPFGATVVEAIIAKCKLIVNDAVGALSFPFKTRDEWIHACETSDVTTWEKFLTNFKGETIENKTTT